MAKKMTKIKHPAFGTVREVTNPDSWREAGWELVEPAKAEKPFVTPVPLKIERENEDKD